MKPIRRAPRSRLAALLATTLLVTVPLLAACDRAGPPPERPREGARPAVAAGSSVQSGPPPTLAPAAALRITPTPMPAPTAAPPSPVAAGPSPSPSIYPIVSNLQPAPGATLPVGDVVIGARVTTSIDLVELVLILNDEAVPQDVSRPNERVKTASMVRSLAAGTYDVRVQARDRQGQLGGYRWQFTVGSGGRQAGATPPPRPTSSLPTIAVPTTGPPAAPSLFRTPLPTATPRPAGR